MSGLRREQVDVLADALLDSGFIDRFIDYAKRAHPHTMASEPRELLARNWARDVLAAMVPPERREFLAASERMQEALSG